jgi:hypothetical protein
VKIWWVLFWLSFTLGHLVRVLTIDTDSVPLRFAPEATWLLLGCGVASDLSIALITFGYHWQAYYLHRWRVLLLVGLLVVPLDALVLSIRWNLISAALGWSLMLAFAWALRLRRMTSCLVLITYANLAVPIQFLSTTSQEFILKTLGLAIASKVAMIGVMYDTCRSRGQAV